MIIRTAFLFFALTVLIPHLLLAQNEVIASGGEAKGEGGTVNYSLGLVINGEASGAGGSLSGGLYQPYQIDGVTGIGFPGINLSYIIYPNPTPADLVLEMDHIQYSSYALYDDNGKLIHKEKVDALRTTISMSQLVNATYFLKVFSNEMEVKTFRVIKN